MSMMFQFNKRNRINHDGINNLVNRFHFAIKMIRICLTTSILYELLIEILSHIIKAFVLLGKQRMPTSTLNVSFRHSLMVNIMSIFFDQRLICWFELKCIDSFLFGTIVTLPQAIRLPFWLVQSARYDALFITKMSQIYKEFKLQIYVLYPYNDYTSAYVRVYI